MTQTTNHTPGPLMIDEGKGCYLLTKEAHPQPIGVGLAYGIGDARLFAAAPEVLDAGKALLAWAETMGGWEAPCWERFAKAIALAEGRLFEVQVQIGDNWENVWGDTEESGTRVPATFFSEEEAEAAIADALADIHPDDGITRENFRIAVVAKAEGRANG